MGHLNIGLGELASGDYPKAIQCFKNAVENSKDPFYREYSRIFLGFSYLLHEKFNKAEEELRTAYNASFKMGFDGSFSLLTEALLGLVSVSKGELSHGIKTIEMGSAKSKELGSLTFHAIFEYILGKVYLKMIQGEGPKNLSFFVNNIGFLLRNYPFAAKKAENHFLKTIAIAKEIGGNGMLGQAYLDLGLLYRLKKRNKQATEYISKAIQLFEQCAADLFLKQSRKILESL